MFREVDLKNVPVPFDLVEGADVDPNVIFKNCKYICNVGNNNRNNV